MQIVREAGEWYEVLALGQRGFVNRNFVSFSPPQPTPQDKPTSSISFGKPFQGDYPITERFGEKPALYAQFLYDGVPLRGNPGLDFFGMPVGTAILATDDGRVKNVDTEPNGFGH